MKRLSLDGWNGRSIPYLEADLTPNILKKIFPVPMDPLSINQAAEVALAGTVELENGQKLVLIYGQGTGTLLIERPSDTLPSVFREALLRECPDLKKHLVWQEPAPPAPH